ncbi:MAG: AMP-binding protein, partial [Dongiaceae bacterium]
MISLSYPNLPAMFWARAVERADAPFLWYKINDQYKSFSWNQIADDVMAVAATLHKLGVQKGDRVVLISESRPEWLVADFAIMQLGAITVPGYTTHGVEDYRYLLDHSGAKLAIVSPSLAAKVQAASKAPVLLIDALEKGDPSNLPKVDIGLDDTACIIYTSGTEGNPKGVML